jgi:hypothetical protein
LQSRENGAQALQSGAVGGYINCLLESPPVTYDTRMVEDKEDNPDDIRKVYPHMTEAELRIARDNLRRYVAVIVRIYDRLTAEGKEWPKPD